MNERHIASVSFGKDSLAMLLLILERRLPLDEVVFYDTGMEFKAIYDTRDRVLPLLTEHGVRYTELRPPRPFVFDMLDKPVNSKKNGLHYGYSWCGGCARWGTACKTHTLDQHAKEAGKNVIQYIGIAADEPKRLERLALRKVAPLAKFGFTESDALRYCYERGFVWSRRSSCPCTRRTFRPTRSFTVRSRTTRSTRPPSGKTFLPKSAASSTSSRTPPPRRAMVWPIASRSRRAARQSRSSRRRSGLRKGGIHHVQP